MLNLNYRQACICWNAFRKSNDELLEFIFERWVAPFAHSEQPFKGGEDEKLIVAFLRHMADVIERGSNHQVAAMKQASNHEEYVALRDGAPNCQSLGQPATVVGRKPQTKESY